MSVRRRSGTVRVLFQARLVESKEKEADEHTALAVDIFPLDDREKVVALGQVVVSVLKNLVVV